LLTKDSNKVALKVDFTFEKSRNNCVLRWHKEVVLTSGSWSFF